MWGPSDQCKAMHCTWTWDFTASTMLLAAPPPVKLVCFVVNVAFFASSICAQKKCFIMLSCTLYPECHLSNVNKCVSRSFVSFFMIIISGILWYFSWDSAFIGVFSRHFLLSCCRVSYFSCYILELHLLWSSSTCRTFLGFFAHTHTKRRCFLSSTSCCFDASFAFSSLLRLFESWWIVGNDDSAHVCYFVWVGSLSCSLLLAVV